MSTSHEGEKIRAVQYLRMSDAQQQYSLDCQRQIIADYAERKGYLVTETYVDEAKSGVSIRGRDGLKMLIREVLASPDFSAVLVTDVSRWGRFQDPDEGAHYEFLCRQAGIAVVYCAEVFDNEGGQASAILKSVKRVMAAEYSRQLSARTRVAIRRVHCAGGCCGGVSPYGFAKELYDPATGETRVLRPGERKTRGGQILKYVWGAPEELAIVRHIFRQYAAHGETPAEIAKALNAQGSRFRDGSQWTSQRINSVLDNELAIGILAFGKSYYRFGFRQKSDSKSWSRLKVFEPVVPKLLFAKAHARRGLSVKQSISDQALIADLQRLFDRYGAVTHRLVATRGIASPSVYARRFGSLGAALRLAGHPHRVRTRKAWTAQTLVWERVKPVLEQLLREEGYLSAAVVDSCPYVPRSATLRKYFGHLPDVFSRAGDTSSGAEKMSKAWVTRARRFAQRDERVDMQPHLARPTIQSAVEEEPELRLRREPAFQLGPAFAVNAR